MTYIKLSNGIKMPQLGIGTFLVKDDTAYQTILEALRIGYRHIDTAQGYDNESEIGRAIKDSGIPREEIFITTKLSARNLGYKEALQELEKSLEKLQTNYVDLYIIHWPSPSISLNQETWRGMEVCYQMGLAKAIGVSNYQRHHLQDIFEVASIRPMVNQIEMHPGLQQHPMKEYLDKNSIHLIGYAPFMKGEVFNKESMYYETLLEIANKYNKTIAQIIIAWGLSRGIFMIPKSVTPQRIKENFEAKDIVLDLEDIKRINALNRGRRVYTDPDNCWFVKQK